MTGLHTEHVALGDLADEAVHAIRRLNHLTRATDGLAAPCDVAEVIAALAAMTAMLPQLLGQLARSLENEHHAGRLRVDDLAPLPDPGQTVHTLASSLQLASQALRRAAAQLDAAHQHAAHLAVTDPGHAPPARGQNSCRSVGPSHLTKRTHGA
jgi:hypothetical protein